VRSSLPGRLPALTPEAELAIYRIVQEALTNAARHASARRIDLSVVLANDQLTISIADDGVGLPASRAERAGLRGMRERALAIGGSLTIGSAPEGGARVTLDVPLPTEVR
jgi:two-component system sensor histidine kinase UhpB